MNAGLGRPQAQAPPATRRARGVAGPAFLDRHAAAVLVLLFAANLALKLPLLSAQGIWFDEAMTVKNGHAPFDLLASLAGDATPPFYAALAQAWMRLFGASLESARALSVLLSSATALLLFHLGRRFAGARTGLYAALLFTVSRYQLHYGHEARPYALVGLLCVASFHVLLTLLERPTRARVVALAALNAALLYTHYVAGYVLAVQLVVALLPSVARRRHVAAVMTSDALAFLSFLPCVAYVASAWPLPMAGWLLAPGPAEVYAVLVAYAGSGPLLAVESLLLAGGLAAIALREHHGARAPDWTIAGAFAAWALLPLALAAAVSLAVPMFLDRYLLYATLGLYLLLAWTIARLPVRASLRDALAAALCVLSLLAAQRDPIVRPDWRGAAERVREATRAGALAVVAPPHQLLPLAYHLPPAFDDPEHLVERLHAAGVVALPDLRAVTELRPGRVAVVLLVLTEASAARHGDLAASMQQAGYQAGPAERLEGIVLLRFAAPPDARQPPPS